MKTNKDIKTKSLIAMCLVITGFAEFSEKVKKLYEGTNDVYSLCVDINKISKGEYVFGKRKLKDFYEKNKQVIDNIQNHLSIQDFIYENYNSNGCLDYNVKYFYNHLKSHLFEVNKILDLLYKLDSLGFKELQFDPNMDFAKNDYEIDMNFGHNFNMYYLENMEVIPNYDKNTIKYKTTGSNYEIKVKPYLNREISSNDREIKLNSLTMDPDKLPKNLTKENTFDKLLNLKIEKDEDLVVNSVQLSVGVYDLKNQFDYTEQILRKIDVVKDKKELSKLLTIMSSCIDDLLCVCKDYDKKIVDDNESITKELLEKEKQIYLRKRYYDKVED